MDAAREPLDAEKERRDALRLAARAAYTLERTPLSLRELGAREPFRGISYRELYGWYADEGWAEERRLNVAAWRRENDDERLSRQASGREREILSLRRLLAEATWLRQQPTVRPKSWEAVAQVHIKTIELFRQWEREEREAEAKEEELAMARRGGQDDFMGDVTDEETRLVAQFLLERRLDLSRREGEERGGAPEVEKRAQGAGGSG